MSEGVIDLFEGMDREEVSVQGNYFSPGSFEVEIERMLVRDTERSGRVFLTETRVTKSSDPQRHPVGSARTWIQGMKNKKIGLRSVLAFLVAAMGRSPKLPEDAEAIKQIQANSPKLISKGCTENCFKGARLKLDVTEKQNKEGTGTYNLHTWSPAA